MLAILYFDNFKLNYATYVTVMDFHLICFAAENVSDETGFAKTSVTRFVPLVVTVTPETDEIDETVSAIGLFVSIVISICVMLLACSIMICEPWYNLSGLA